MIILFKTQILSLFIALLYLKQETYLIINPLKYEKKKHYTTPRGGIINEEDLYNALITKQISGAALV